MTDNITVSRELLRQVLRLMDKALDTDNVFGKLHNDAMDCLGALEAALEQAPVQEQQFVVWASQTAIDIATEGGEGIIVGAEADCLIPLCRCHAGWYARPN